MKKIILFTFITMIFNFLNGQGLNGKWILKDIDSGNGRKGYPGFQLIDINNGSFDIYTDFSLKEKASRLKMNDGNLINLNNQIDSKYEIINLNHIKWFVNGKHNDKDAVFECDFYRLEPTVTSLQKEDIEKLTFVITENERESEYIFNKELWDKQTIEILNIKEGEKKIIEKIDSTFFVSMYYNGERTASIPIKEVSPELLKLYAVPSGGPMEMIAYRKK